MDHTSLDIKHNIEGSNPSFVIKQHIWYVGAPISAIECPIYQTESLMNFYGSVYNDLSPIATEDIALFHHEIQVYPALIPKAQRSPNTEP